MRNFDSSIPIINQPWVTFSSDPRGLVVYRGFDHARIKVSQAVINVIDGFKSERLRVVLMAGFLFSVGFTFFTTFFGVYFAIVGSFIAVSQAVVVAKVAKKLADWKELRFSLFGLGAMMLVYFAIPTTSSYFLYLVIPFFTVLNGLTMANTSSQPLFVSSVCIILGGAVFFVLFKPKYVMEGAHA